MTVLNFQRAVGLVILGLSTAAAVAIWFALAAPNPSDLSHDHRGVVGGIWHVLYDSAPPSRHVLITAVALALIFATIVAWFEYRVLTNTRRSAGNRSTPLVPKRIMAATRGVFAGPITITVLIPAHNEESRLGSTITSLRQQEPPPRRIIVVADNCTDATVEIARTAGVEVIETVNNHDKKAGALNQVLCDLLPQLGDNDLVMMLDADTLLDQGFLATASDRFATDRALMAVGGLFYGEGGSGIIGQFQRNEYARYSRDIDRRNGRLFVLTGTASIFRPLALATVADSRGGRLPGRRGDVYDTAALTEDNELTLALKTLGALMISPRGCRVVTEVMPTWRALWTQRLRWLRGALENLGSYGLTRQTFRYWSQQVGIGYGVIAFATYAAFMILLVTTTHPWVWYPFWLGVGGLLVTERVISTWSGGWRARLLAALMIPELLYALFLNAVFMTGVLNIALGKRAYWDRGDHAMAVEPC